MTSVDPVYVDLWGVFVTTPEVTKERAQVNVKTTVKNEMSEKVNLRTETTVVDASGKQIALASVDGSLEALSSNEYEQELTVTEPQLWSPDSPTRIIP